MHLLDRIVNNPRGKFSKEGIAMIRYADDFILISRHIRQEMLIRLHHYIDRMGLMINKEKSKLVNAKESPFDFLGFTFRYDQSILFKENKFWNVIPRQKSQKKIRQKINTRFKEINHYPALYVVK